MHKLKTLITLVKSNFSISRNFSINEIELHRAMVSLILQIKNIHIRPSVMDVLNVAFNTWGPCNGVLRIVEG